MAPAGARRASCLTLQWQTRLAQPCSSRTARRELPVERETVIASSFDAPDAMSADQPGSSPALGGGARLCRRCGFSDVLTPALCALNLGFPGWRGPYRVLRCYVRWDAARLLRTSKVVVHYLCGRPMAFAEIPPIGPGTLTRGPVGPVPSSDALDVTQLPPGIVYPASVVSEHVLHHHLSLIAAIPIFFFSSQDGGAA